ncbi:FliM/FliN family flagellar motor switch protein [Fontisphaera persica]|uniref:flagellar motor switch protein FliM n=1 Tax=Fontisphaera persica TaxID=2974023 RepID=UPI0024C0AF30|nr:FliM/FliN family flagellar motor switch protein [Fontisphaera persica]WCJ58220.1 FliM/FliN family flagellar motor switch protein [Fontisphaera persica]
MSAAPAQSSAPAEAPAKPLRWQSTRGDMVPLRQLQWLRQRHEGYARAMADWLTLQLRMDFRLTPKGAVMRPVAEFLEGLPSPTHLSLFKLTPNGRVLYFNLPCALALAMVDRWLGGPGLPEAEERPLSDLETGLLEPGVRMFLEQWKQYWGGGRGWNVTPVGCESSTQFLEVKDSEELLCVLNFDAALGETTGTVALAMPVSLVRELLPQPAAAVTPEAAPKPEAARKPAWNPLLEDVVVKVTAEWCGLELTARELAQLQPGDQLVWEGGVAGEVRLRIGGRPFFTGRLGTQNGCWAVQIQARAT